MSIVEAAKVLDKIRERGYWSVVIRPTTFDESRVAYSHLFPIVERNAVRFYRWGYPIVNPPSMTQKGDDWIGQEFDRDGDIEVWRFHTSGLFVQNFAIHGDWEDPSLHGPNLPGPTDKNWSPNQYIYDFSTIYSFVEIFEFASRLAQSPAGDSRMRVEISLHNLKGRRLVSNFSPIRPSNDSKIQKSQWHYTRDFTQTELIALHRDFAADATQKLFDRFEVKVSVEHVKLLQERIRS